MTGYVTEKMNNLHDDDGLFYLKTAPEIDKFWDRLMEEKRNKSLMGCSVKPPRGKVETSVYLDDFDTGVLAGHAYAINDVFELKRKESKTGGPAAKRPYHRMLRVRNPHGKGEWLGKWSDDSEERLNYKEELDKYIAELDTDEQFRFGEDDGTFLINFKSWR